MGHVQADRDDGGFCQKIVQIRAEILYLADEVRKRAQGETGQSERGSPNRQRHNHRDAEGS